MSRQPDLCELAALLHLHPQGMVCLLIGIAVCLATAPGTRCMPVSVCTPEPHQHFASGECASVLAHACGGTSGCSGCLGRRERGVGCPTEPRHSGGPMQVLPCAGRSRAEDSPSVGSSCAACRVIRCKALHCRCQWEMLFLPKSIIGNGSKSGSVETQGSHEGKCLNVCDENAENGVLSCSV